MQLPTLEERRAHLAQVPECFRELVSTHVKIFWQWKQYDAAHRNKKQN